MQPSVGRIVHYSSYGTPGGEYGIECRAAIVTAVTKTRFIPEHGVALVDLCVLNPTGMFFKEKVWYEVDEPRGGTWHWPEQV